MVNFAQLTSFSGSIGVVQVYNWITHETECQVGIGRAPDQKVITKLTPDKEFAICGNNADDFRACHQVLQIENSTTIVRLGDLQLPQSLLKTNIKSTQLQDGTWIISGKDDLGNRLFYQRPEEIEFLKIEFYNPSNDPLCITGIDDRRLLLFSPESNVIIDLVDGTVDEDSIPLNSGSTSMCAALTNENGYQTIACSRESCSVFTSASSVWTDVPLPLGVDFVDVFVAMDGIHGLGNDKSLFTLNEEQWEDSGNSLDLIGTKGSQVRFGYGVMDFCNEPIVADGGKISN